jgi:hypothetical protein
MIDALQQTAPNHAAAGISAWVVLLNRQKPAQAGHQEDYA